MAIGICSKHNCKMVPLFTSWNCDVCDTNSVNRIRCPSCNADPGWATAWPSPANYTLSCSAPDCLKYVTFRDVYPTQTLLSNRYWIVDVATLHEGDYWIETSTLLSQERGVVKMGPNGLFIQRAMYRPKCPHCQTDNWSKVIYDRGFRSECANCSVTNHWSVVVSEKGSVFMINKVNREWDGNQWV